MKEKSEIRTEHLQAAIIGMWRMGATNIEISVALKLYESQVNQIIKTYINEEATFTNTLN